MIIAVPIAIVLAMLVLPFMLVASITLLFVRFSRWAWHLVARPR